MATFKSAALAGVFIGAGGVFYTSALEALGLSDNVFSLLLMLFLLVVVFVIHKYVFGWAWQGPALLSARLKGAALRTLVWFWTGAVSGSLAYPLWDCAASWVG